MGEASKPTSCEPGAGGGTCAQCGVRQPKKQFSSKQWGLKEGFRRCKTCTGVAEVPNATPDFANVDPADLVCEPLAPADYFQPSRIQSWWMQYQEGFRAEQEWMEARGKKSLYLGMGLEADDMAHLVFH